MLASLGQAVSLTTAPLEIAAVDQGLAIVVPATGLTEGREIVGELDATLGNLTLDTTDGQGTAVVDLGNGLSVEGNASIRATGAGLEVTLDEPELVFHPAAPDVALIEGGSDAVTQVDVIFHTGLNSLPDGASLSVRFAKDATSLVADPAAVFQQAAQAAGGSIDDHREDVAFLIDVMLSGITNQDLGDNVVAMTVNRAWYDQRVAVGKEMAISKIADDGAVYAAAANCNATDDLLTCSATFTGSAGGFSLFALLAIIPSPAPAPTATPTPTPMAPSPTPTVSAVELPTPTPTPTPMPTATSSPTPAAGVLLATPTPASSPTAVSAGPGRPTPRPESTLARAGTPSDTPGQEASGGRLPGGVIIGGLFGLLVLGGAIGYYLLVVRRRGGVTSPGG